MLTRKTTFAAVIALGAAASAAFAAAQDPDVRARQEAMGLIGANVKKLTAMAKGEADFNAAEAQGYFAIIEEKASMVPTLFENESIMDPENEAKPAIWENWEDFLSKANDLKMAAEAGASVDSPEALGAAMGQIGGTCKACHMTYKD